MKDTEYAVCYGPDRSHVNLHVELFPLLREARARVAAFGPSDHWRLLRLSWPRAWSPVTTTVIAEGGPDVEQLKARAKFKAQYDKASK